MPRNIFKTLAYSERWHIQYMRHIQNIYDETKTKQNKNKKAKQKKGNKKQNKTEQNQILPATIEKSHFLTL